MLKFLPILLIAHRVACQLGGGYTPPTVSPLEKLTGANFTEFIESHPRVLAIFCTPWSSECKTFHRELLALTRQEYKPELKLATIDTTTEITLAIKYKIKKHPTLLLIRGQHHLEYKGELTYPLITRWLTKNNHEPLISIATDDELKKAQEADIAYILAVYKDDQKLYTAYEEVSNANFQVLFYITRLESAKKLVENPQDFNLIAVRTFNEGQRSISSKTPFSKEEILKFLEATKQPYVLTISDETLDATTRKRKTTAVFLRPNTNSTALYKAFEGIAKEKIGRINYIQGMMQEEHAMKLARYLEVDELMEHVKIVEFHPDHERVYSFARKATPENLRAWFKDYENGKLEVFDKSEEEPEENKGPVYKVVAKTWDDVIYDESKHVVVLLVSDHCRTCELMRRWIDDFISTHKIPPDFKFVEFNTSKNEHPDVSEAKTPNIMVYVRRKKRLPVLMKNDVNDESLETFLLETTLHRFEHLGKLDLVDDSL